MPSSPLSNPSSTTPFHFTKSKSLISKPSQPPVTLPFRRSLSLSVSASCATASPPGTTTSPSSPSSSSLYDVLGIPICATVDEIKAAYRRRARSCHPDAAASNGGGDEFIKVHNAYSTLSDPEKRADYDRRLCRRIGTMVGRGYVGLSASPTSGSSFRRFPRRNWETDQCW